VLYHHRRRLAELAHNREGGIEVEEVVEGKGLSLMDLRIRQEPASARPVEGRLLMGVLAVA